VCVFYLGLSVLSIMLLCTSTLVLHITSCMNMCQCVCAHTRISLPQRGKEVSARGKKRYLCLFLPLTACLSPRHADPSFSSFVCVCFHSLSEATISRLLKISPHRYLFFCLSEGERYADLFFFPSQIPAFCLADTSF